MKIGFATMPRSGSEFVVRLTREVMGSAMPGAVVSVSPGRVVGPSTTKSRALIEHIAQGRALDYFRSSGAACAKIEAPGADTLCFEMTEAFPELRWLTSLRRLEHIIASHHNIQSWGWPEAKVLTGYLHDLVFLEHVAAKGKLFVVNIDEPSRFHLGKMLRFLGREEAAPSAASFIDRWPVVNPLRRQKELAFEEICEPTAPPGLETLRTRHPWLGDIDERYRRLWQACV